MVWAFCLHLVGFLSSVGWIFVCSWLAFCLHLAGFLSAVGWTFVGSWLDFCLQLIGSLSAVGWIFVCSWLDFCLHLAGQKKLSICPTTSLICSKANFVCWFSRLSHDSNPIMRQILGIYYLQPEMAEAQKCHNGIQ